MSLFKSRDNDTVGRPGYSPEDASETQDMYSEFEQYGINLTERVERSRQDEYEYEAYRQARLEREQARQAAYDEARQYYHHAASDEIVQPDEPLTITNAAKRNSSQAHNAQQGAHVQSRGSASQASQDEEVRLSRPEGPSIDLQLAAARAQGRREAESAEAVRQARAAKAAGAAAGASAGAQRDRAGTASGTASGAKTSGTRSGKKAKKAAGQKKKASIGVKILRVVLLLVVVVLIYGIHLLSKIHSDTLDEKNLGIVPVEGYTNILLLGVDTRDMDDVENSRTDAIMIMSINDETKAVTLTSIYRDTYLRMGGTDDYDKITHAHMYGGPQMVITSLNEAMNLDIQDYVLVNFKGVADAIDAIGGITIDVEEYEIEQLNKYTVETAETIGRSDYHLVSEPGEQVLDGCQAVSYGRIRKGVGDDYKRTERMRTVLKLLMAEVKQMNAFELANFADAVLPQCKSDISKAEMMKLALELKNADIENSKGFPYNVTDGYINDVSYVIPISLVQDVEEFHETVFGQEDYEPTETAREISSNVSLTGY